MGGFVCRFCNCDSEGDNGSLSLEISIRNRIIIVYVCHDCYSHLSGSAIIRLKGRFGQLPLRRFDTRILESFQSERLQAGKKKLKSEKIVGNKPATINRHVAILKHMFTKAVEWDMVEEDVSKRIHRVKLLEEQNARLRYLATEECNRLIEACDKHLQPIVMTALHTGMRKGEILKLKWENEDLKHGFILLNRTKNGERREIYPLARP